MKFAAFQFICNVAVNDQNCFHFWQIVDKVNASWLLAVCKWHEYEHLMTAKLHRLNGL